MTVVMTKYRFNDRDYLVYEQNMFSKDFAAKTWNTIADVQYGVGADCIIVIQHNNSKTTASTAFYDTYGVKINDALVVPDAKCIAAYHLGKLNITVARDIEVRFTQSYIDRLCTKAEKSAYIA